MAVPRRRLRGRGVGTINEVVPFLNRELIPLLRQMEVDALGAPEVPVELFGAAGDGQSDDYPALFAAFASGYPLRFRAGRTYLTSNTLLLRNNHVIQAPGATVVQTTTGRPALLGSSVSNVRLIGGTYQGVGAAAFTDPDAGLISFKTTSGGAACSNVQIEQLVVRDAYTGISALSVGGLWVTSCEIDTFVLFGVLASKSSYFHIDRNYIHDSLQRAFPAYGVMATGDDIGGAVQKASSISGNKIANVPSWDGIMAHDCASLEVIGNDIRNVRSGIDIGHFQKTNIIKNIIVANNYIEAATEDAWDGDGANEFGIALAGYDATARVTNATVTGNIIKGFFSYAAAFHGNPAHMVIADVERVTVTGNVIAEGGASTDSKAGILLLSVVNDATVCGNSLQGKFASGGIRLVQVSSNQLFIGANTINQTDPADVAVVVTDSTVGSFSILGNPSNATVPFSVGTSTITWAPTSTTGVVIADAVDSGTGVSLALRAAGVDHLTVSGNVIRPQVGDIQWPVGVTGIAIGQAPNVDLDGVGQTHSWTAQSALGTGNTVGGGIARSTGTGSLHHGDFTFRRGSNLCLTMEEGSSLNKNKISLGVEAMENPGQYSSSVEVVTFSATPTFDWNLGQNKRMVLTANVTAVTLSNPRSGAQYSIELVQDGPGNHTIVWPASVKFATGDTGTLSVAGSATDMFELRYDGSSYIAIGVKKGF